MMFVSQNKMTRCLCVAMFGIWLLTVGCRRKAQVSTAQTTIATTTEQTSTFETAVDFLNSLDQYRPETIQQQILTNLGDWSRLETASVDWLADPMINDLPEDLRPSDKSFEVTAFERYDALDLQEAVWMRDVSKAVARQPLAAPRIVKWLEESVANGSLSSDEVADLSLAYRLFDWTIRNTQLDDVEDPTDLLPSDTVTKTLRHRYQPWQCLLYGHADWIERARMYVLLCRQVGIDCVMLVADRGDEPEQEWCAGVWVGEELYLFDPLLGVPLPGQGGAPLATLSEYAENPELLDGLVVGDEPYRIATSDLENLSAHIDASPSALSQRMKQIESRLNGKQKMVLTSTPTPLARALRKSKQLTGSKIWLEPYRAIQFLQNFVSDTSQAPELAARLQREQQPFQSRNSLMRGRLLHLRGNYRGDPNDLSKPGANKLYMNSRLPTRELERFAMPLSELRKVAKESPLLMGLPDDPAEAQSEYERRVAFSLANAIWSKDNASIWLAMIAMDKQEFEVAKNHLTRLLGNPESKWLAQARYNLARACESLGRQNGDLALLKRARDLYESDDSSPQYAGNRLRATLLQLSQ